MSKADEPEAKVLLPCPFCGDEAETDEGYSRAGHRSWWASCVACPACTSPQATEEDAIAAWNRRAAPSPSPAAQEVEQIALEIEQRCLSAPFSVSVAQGVWMRGIAARLRAVPAHAAEVDVEWLTTKVYDAVLDGAGDLRHASYLDTRRAIAAVLRAAASPGATAEGRG